MSRSYSPISNILGFYFDFLVVIVVVAAAVVVRGRFHQNVYKQLFTIADPKSVKRQSSYQCLLGLLGSVLTKVLFKMLIKSTHGVNFINMFTQSFYKPRSQKRKRQSCHKRLFVHLVSLRVKAAHKTLVKSTPFFVVKTCLRVSIGLSV